MGRFSQLFESLNISETNGCYRMSGNVKINQELIDYLKESLKTYEDNPTIKEVDYCKVEFCFSTRRPLMGSLYPASQYLQQVTAISSKTSMKSMDYGIFDSTSTSSATSSSPIKTVQIRISKQSQNRTISERDIEMLNSKLDPRVKVSRLRVGDDVYTSSVNLKIKHWIQILRELTITSLDYDRLVTIEIPFDIIQVEGDPPYDITQYGLIEIHGRSSGFNLVQKLIKKLEQRLEEGNSS